MTNTSNIDPVIDAALKILALPYTVNEAVVVFPGRYEHTRVEFGVRLWKEKQSKYLLVAGISETAVPGSRRYDKKYLSNNFGIAEDDLFILTQDYAAHTYAQAEWASDKIMELNISNFVLTASYYHILTPNAFCNAINGQFTITYSEKTIIKVDTGLVEVRNIEKSDSMQYVKDNEEIVIEL